jgi:glucose-6-phosphate 1-dehydrogenase
LRIGRQSAAGRWQSNYLRFRLSPDVSIALGIREKVPGERIRGQQVELIACSGAAGRSLAYERLLGDAARGDPSLFATEQSVEAAWRIVDPIVGDRTPLEEYDPGSFGPAGSAALAPPRNWREPLPTPRERRTA